MVRKRHEKDYAWRALAVLHLWATQGNVAEVAHRGRPARSSVYGRYSGRRRGMRTGDDDESVGSRCGAGLEAAGRKK